MTRDATSLRHAREETIDTLCRRFAADDLSMPELERRLERARSARTRDELRSLLADLEPKAPATVASGPRSREQPAVRRDTVPEAATASRPSPGGEVRPSSHLAFAVMGGTKRAGRWRPPSELAAVAIMGGVELDFRDAVFGGEAGEVVDINCFAFWGGIEIVVPPDVHVDTHGFALMGGFEQTSDLQTDPPPGAPTIRVNGFALMGGVEVKVMARGRALKG